MIKRIYILQRKVEEEAVEEEEGLQGEEGEEKYEKKIIEYIYFTRKG